MKYAVAAVVSSLAFASGSAFAEGCNYGKYSDVVADKGEPLQSVVEPAQDPRLLALLKRKEDQVESIPAELN
jgi:hypothetical protein